jgi:HEAT repeat protein
MKYIRLFAFVASFPVLAFAQQARYDDVVRNLRNPDPKARMQALELLRESKYAEAIQPIAPLVNDPVDAIQLAAIETELSFYTVGEVAGRKRMAFIVEVRNSGAAESVFDAGPLAAWPRAIPPELLANLFQAVDDEHPKVRTQAIYTIGTIARAPLAAEHVGSLIEALDHYDPVIRRAAAQVAGRLAAKAAGEVLIKTVNDSQPPVRFAAMRALGEIREQTAVTALTEQLQHYRKGEGGWSALDGLARIGHPSSVPLFTSRLTDRDEYFRRSAAEGLGRAGAVTEIPVLESLVARDGSEMVRAAAAFALQKLGYDAMPALARMLASDRLAPQIAGYVIELGPAVAPSLGVHLKDPNAAVRGNVSLVLGAIGGDAEIRAIEPLLQDRNRDVVRAAQSAIERITLRKSVG